MCAALHGSAQHVMNLKRRQQIMPKKIVQLNEEVIKGQIKEIGPRQRGKDASNGLMEAEAEKLN